MKIGYSYIRFSSREQRKGDSLRRQLASTAVWCQRNAVTLDTSTTFHDLAVSSLHGLNRSDPDRFALAAFLRLVEEGGVPKDSYLIVENLDRLSREHVRAAAQLFLGILNSGVNIVTTTPERVFRHDSEDETDIIIAIIELQRGHSESVIKSERVGAAWKRRKENARTSMQPVTKMCPKWLEVAGGKYHTIPERVKVVRRVFSETLAGRGIGVIVRELNAEKIPPFGVGKVWQKSSVARLLKNRSVFGEYQPCEGIERKPVGTPIPNYYPVVVTENEFLAAQNATQNRKRTGGRRLTKAVNLFTSLVVDGEDGTHWAVQTSGTRRPTKPIHKGIMNTEGQAKGAKRKAIPYRIFESEVLRVLREVSVSDVLPKGKSKEADRLSELALEIAATEQRMSEAEKAVLENPGSSALVRVLVKLEEQKKQLQEEYDKVKRSLATPLADGIAQARSLIDLLATAENKEEIRNKLRARITAVVEAITVWYAVDTSEFSNLFAPRSLYVEISFRNTDYRRHVRIDYQPARCNHAETVKVAEGQSFHGGHKLKGWKFTMEEGSGKTTVNVK